MAHDHQHELGASFRGHVAEQFLTLFVAGVFGLVGILMYRNGQLGYILALKFHIPVLIGALAVLALVILWAMSLWLAGGCDRHNDAHNHELSWVFSRLVVLSFPVGLFLIGVPNSGFSQDRIRMLLGGDDALTIAAVDDRNGAMTDFNGLIDAAIDPGMRERMQGQTAVAEGRIRWLSANDHRQFTLFRLKMTCCAADTVPLKVRIVLKNGTLSGINDFDWVEMKGRIQFVQAPNSQRYVPVIVVEDIQDIRKIELKREYD